MQDRIHQPYRMKACPLLPLLLPLTENPGVLGVALSGAGPSVLIISEEADSPSLPAIVRQAAGDQLLEVIQTKISTGILEAAG